MIIAKKLTLKKETLRHLQPVELINVQGGGLIAGFLIATVIISVMACAPEPAGSGNENQNENENGN